MTPLYIFLVLLSEICQVPALNNTSSITQDSGVITANVGQSVILHCLCHDEDITFLYWYQQSLGGKPLIISTRMKYKTEASISPAYEERFQLSTKGQEGINNLIIKDLRLSDSAIYYCGMLEFNAIEFGQGAFLHVKASLSTVQTAVHQLAEPLQSGESVNLSCTVYAEPCAGEQGIYWFRHDAARPAIVYRSADQCERLSDEEPHKKICTSNLTLKSVSFPDAGMYYCALASCGEIVFGSGTRVEIADSNLPMVYCLSVAVAVSIIAVLVLAQKLCFVCKGTVSHLACSAVTDTLNQDAANLHYAALSLNRASERHRQEDNVEQVCVYSRVKSMKA